LAELAEVEKVVAVFGVAIVDVAHPAIVEPGP
jgi:hypothetical protein